jgi:AraC-like DNA-binding protein
MDGAPQTELAVGAVHPLLRSYVRGVVGFREHAPRAVRRRELPFGGVAVILDLGHGWTITPTGGPEAGPSRHASFAGGLIDSPVLSEHGGAAHALQVDLTPIGARVLLGVPGRELAGRVVPLSALFGAAADRLVERLAGTPGWPARFALVEQTLLSRVRTTAGPRPDVEWAWRRITQSAGSVRVRDLVRELGCSDRHLATRFGEEIGMTPKTYGRLLRFERAVDALLDGREELGHIAARCGYSDQAHFNRDVRAFAGTTPTALAAERTPAGFLV